MKAIVSAEQSDAAPADVIHHCIADYREDHRLEGFARRAVMRPGAGKEESRMRRAAGPDARDPLVLSEFGLDRTLAGRGRITARAGSRSRG
jgi:hypothetical protein